MFVPFQSVAILSAPFLPSRLLAADPVPQPFPDWLRQRGLEQTREAQDYKVERNFNFTDRFKESGITFAQQAVEDSNKHYKATITIMAPRWQSPMSTAMGTLGFDVYFVTQLGNNGNSGAISAADVLRTSLPGQAWPSRTGFAWPQASPTSITTVTPICSSPPCATATCSSRIWVEESFAILLPKRASAMSAIPPGRCFSIYNDGLLDLYVCNVGRYTTDVKGPGGYYVG